MKVFLETGLTGGALNPSGLELLEGRDPHHDQVHVDSSSVQNHPWMLFGDVRRIYQDPQNDRYPALDLKRGLLALPGVTDFSEIPAFLRSPSSAQVLELRGTRVRASVLFEMERVFDERPVFTIASAFSSYGKEPIPMSARRDLELWMDDYTRRARNCVTGRPEMEADFIARQKSKGSDTLSPHVMTLIYGKRIYEKLAEALTA